MSSTGGTDSEQRPAAEDVVQGPRRRRLTQLGGVLVAAVAIIAIIVVTTGRDGNTASVPTVTSELAGMPQSGNTLGIPTAPVVLIYFGDLECPFCREFTLDVLPTLISKYVKTGKLRIQYHSLETATREPATFLLQQVAALAAG